MAEIRPSISRRLLSIALPGAAILIVLAAVAVVRLLPQGEPEPIEVAAGTPHLVFAEFGLNADRIYIAPASDLSDRTLVDTVDHAAGWGINPAVEPAGPLVAYTVIPNDAPAARDTPAELWVMNIETRNKTRLARDADLLVAPIFVDGGQGLIYRRSNGMQQEIVRVEVNALTRHVMHAEQTSFGMFPVGLDAQGSLLFVRISDGGTDLYTMRDGGTPAFAYHLSDHIARDWALSPDGRVLAYLAADFAHERALYRAHLLSIAELEETALLVTDSTDGEHYGSAWLPDASGVAVGQEATLGPAESALLLSMDGEPRALPAPVRGFDVPLMWSADGRYLAVRAFDGQNSVYPGIETTVVIDVRTGERRVVDVPTEVIVIGWYTGD